MQMKNERIIKQMTLEEKAAILSGKNEWETRAFERLGIPSIFLADGPNGIRKQAGSGDHLGLNPSLPATCFPTAATIANSWDEQLGEKIGKALGNEAVSLGVNILLGPGLNIKRIPLCGRNFEYFSEDPYLSGKMAAAYIRGIQSQGVYACPKHFAVNNLELRRMTMNSVLDERTLREIYLTGFEIAVKEGKPGCIMSSYNRINGIYANENTHLLKQILREEWKYNGLIVTDWGGCNSHTAGVAAGSDLEMPTPGFESAREIVNAVENDELSLNDVDCCVDRIIEAARYLKNAPKGEMSDEQIEEHHSLAREAAAESAVLLKNEENILPLEENVKVALIGDFAITPRYQGAGSSMVNANHVDSMQQLMGKYNVQVAGVAKGYSRVGGTAKGVNREELKKEALQLAAKAQVVIYCFGLDEASEIEGMDRRHMELQAEQIELLKELAQVNSQIVGILSAGSPVEMPWLPCCKALLHGYLYGEAGAGAMWDILVGKVNPSGKLAESYVLNYTDSPAYRYFPGKTRNAEYREGLFVGYRYYNTRKIEVQFPFGFGLSYTSFFYDKIKVTEEGVSFDIENDGKFDGAEIAQLYIHKIDGAVFRPSRELKGFKKIYLKAGQRQKVEIPFDDKTFRYWNVKTGQWEKEGGMYAVLIGSSVEDIRLVSSIEIKGTTDEYPYQQEKMPSYFSGSVENVSDSEFQCLLGHPIPDGEWKGELTLNDSLCQMYYAKSRLARFAYKILEHKVEHGVKSGVMDLNALFIYNIPFRGIAKMTGGVVNMEMAGGMVQVVNGHFFSGIKKIIKGFFKNRRYNREYDKMISS